MSNGSVVDSGGKDSECEGSLTLSGEGRKVVVTGDEEIKIDIDKVEVEGCKCFTLYSKKNGKGKSYFVGNWQTEHFAKDIGWSGIRSVRRAACESMAMPMWIVIVIVLAVVLVIGALVLFGFKKYRNYVQVER